MEFTESDYEFLETCLRVARERFVESQDVMSEARNDRLVEQFRHQVAKADDLIKRIGNRK